MNPGFVVHTSHISRTSISRYPIKDGSQVLVRIISDKGCGKYEGSVAGARIMLNSKAPMTPGTSFKATISTQNGQVLLFPLNESGEIAENAFFTMEAVQNEQLASLLQSLGLNADDLSYHLMQQLKQLNMKLEPELLSKIYNLSVKFKGKEKRAAELVAILAKKGIDFSEEELLSLLQELGNDPDDNQDDSQKNRGQEYALLNKINSIKNTWQFLPYEIVSNISTFAKGNLSFFIDETAALKLLNVDCNWLSNNHRYLFSLEYEKGLCRNIKMSGEGIELSRIANILDQRLAASGKEINIELVEPEFLEGTACAQEEFFAFGGEV
ncbi:MAG: hypothetical protein J6X78_13300 [Treponema sp.]|nr:hypothetical protein [Treponema sp.]